MTLDVSKTDQNIIHEVSKLYREYISPDLARLIKLGGYGTVEAHAEGDFVYDVQGRAYLDFAGGYGVFSLGHRNSEVVQAVREQLNLMPLSSRVFLNSHQAYLAEKLAKLTPGQLKYSFFSNSGTEAVEAALKLARAATGRSRFVSTIDSYHGKTLGSLSVSGRPNYQDPFRPLLPDVHHISFGDIEALEQALTPETAAFIIEPVQGEGGIHPAPDGYLAKAQQLCREREVLLIADEVQCGLGRTGLLFACQHWGIEPDILVLAKALGGGVMPIGATISTPEVHRAYRGKPLLHTSTFGGNPLSCVAALKTLEILERGQLVDNAKQAGLYLLDQLKKLGHEFPDLIQEARGLGLMIGLELKEDRFGGSVISEMARQRVVAVYTLNQPKVIRFEPALGVERTEIEQMLTALHQALKITRERMLQP